MTAREKKVLQEAMKLPPEARAALAGSLLQSIEGETDEDAEAAWSAEIEKRLRDIDAGSARLVPWPVVRRRLLRSLNGLPLISSFMTTRGTKL